MKKIISLILTACFFMALPGLNSCSDNFLETKSSTDLSDKLVFKTTASTRGVLYGIYKYMRSWGCTPYVRMDCCGLHTNLLTYDVMASDITVLQGSWYFYDYDYWHTGSETVFRTDHLWRFYYTVINNCNNILFNLGDAEGPLSEKNAIEAETKALRAFSYYNLVQLYQQTYQIAKDRQGVPVYTKPAEGKAESTPRSSVEKVYELITEDLEYAVKYLPANRESKYYINTNVAEGILARVYMTMGRWSDAEQMAGLAKKGYPLMTAEQWTQGFNDLNNPEWIWGIHQTAEQNVGWGSSFSVLDFQRGDQKNFRINSKLAEKYASTDIRKTLIVPVGNLFGNRKFREPDALNLGQMVLMRSSEMCLIQAEAKARQKEYTDAQDFLFELQQKRDPQAKKSELEGDDLIDQILLERRKELWAEGFGLFDLLRCQKPLKREGDHTSIKNFPENSWSFIFQIPRSELDVNKGIKAEDQNPTEGVLRK